MPPSLQGGPHRRLTFRLPDSDFTSVSILTDRLMPVAVPDANGRPLYGLDDDEDVTIPLLSYEKQTGLGRIFGTVFDIDAIQPRMVPVASSHLALLLGLALEGRGIAWVPASVVRGEIERKTLVVREDPKITALGSKFRHKVHVEVHLRDGTVEKQTCEAPRGSEKSFASQEDIVGKFRKLTRHVLPEKQRDDIVDAVLNMEKLSSATRLVELLWLGK
jgi:hypothetical protein